MTLFSDFGGNTCVTLEIYLPHRSSYPEINSTDERSPIDSTRYCSSGNSVKILYFAATIQMQWIAVFFLLQFTSLLHLNYDVVSLKFIKDELLGLRNYNCSTYHRHRQCHGLQKN